LSLTELTLALKEIFKNNNTKIQTKLQHSYFKDQGLSHLKFYL